MDGLRRVRVVAAAEGATVTDLQFGILLAVLIIASVAMVATIPWAVERAVAVRLKGLQEMFDRALMHGGSIDTLARSVKAASETAISAATEAQAKVGAALDAISLLHIRVRALEDHPFLRPPGGQPRLDK